MKNRISIFILLILSVLCLPMINAQTTDKDPPKENREKIFKNDFFIDALGHGGHGAYKFTYTQTTVKYQTIGFDPALGFTGGFSSTHTTHNVSHQGAGGGFGLRLGNKWYFGKNKKYRPGFTATWFRADFQSLGEGQNNFSFSILPNVGFINAFKINNNMGIEVNMNAGFNLIVVPKRVFFGASINPNIKFQYKAFSVGIDLNYIPTIAAVEQNHFLQVGLFVGCVLGK